MHLTKNLVPLLHMEENNTYQAYMQGQSVSVLYPCVGILVLSDP